MCHHCASPGEQTPPIAIPGRDVITQPGQTVTLNGIESLALGDAHITDYQWAQQHGDDGVKMEVKTVELQGAGLSTGIGNQWDTGC